MPKYTIYFTIKAQLHRRGRLLQLGEVINGQWRLPALLSHALTAIKFDCLAVWHWALKLML